ncbi:hypothetical protein DSM104299_00199 [Baekduia alba]|uniref:ABC transporter substrate-binding protein n=1 Tax=Baekduia alba TaxID=2997333 RepID=UPI0023413952|nr:ABC transporter substrate-binding protein [Baekduia alba]WCB91528.1 hypothetical protein DSM104299_00199 [Baekduia alba]
MTRARPILRLLAAMTAVLAVVVAAGCGSSDGGRVAAADKDTGLKTLRVASLPIADLGAYFYALQNGLFTKHGLKVEDTSVAGGAAGIAAMAGGSVDLTYTNNVSVLLSASQHMPITIASGANLNQPKGKGDMASLIVAKGIRAASDLKGKTIAVNALNNINWLYTRAWLRDHGVDPDSVKYVELDFPDQPAALLSDKVQATLIPEPFASGLVAKGAHAIGFPYRMGPHGETGVASFASTRQFAAKNADVLQQFRAALDDAIAAIGKPDGRKQLAAALAAHTKLPAAAAETVTLPVYTTATSRPLLEAMERVMEQEHAFKGDAPNLDDLLQP